MHTPTLPPTATPCRVGEVKRATKETDVYVKVNLDGTGQSDCNTGIPFLDHMLDQLASHGLLDLNIKASGDITLMTTIQMKILHLLLERLCFRLLEIGKEFTGLEISQLHLTKLQ